MRTNRNAADRRKLVERLGRLRPDAQAQWGTLDTGRMLCHLSAALDEALGARTIPPQKGPAMLRHFPMKQMAVYVIPMPRGAKAPAELLPGSSGDFEAERRRVVERLERAAALPRGAGPAHFLFGAMTTDQWNALTWKHIDHHLRQFGC